MKTITLLSPNVIKFDLENGMISKISHQRFSQSKLGFDIPINYSYFVYLTEKNEDGKFILPLDADTLFGKEVITQIHHIKEILAQCAQMGEHLNMKLKSFNDKYKNDPELADIYLKYNSRYEKLDFMGHRNLLSDLIKSKKIDTLNVAIASFEQKSFTKAFYEFIMDRNKYTHGDLMLWYPSRKTLLEYRDDEGKIVYGEVNQEILNSYIEVYKTFNGFFDDVDK